MTDFTLSATPLYGGLLTLLLIWLSFRVVSRRQTAKVSVGDGGDKAMIKRMRAHANFVEYAPIGILLLLMAELQGAPLWVCHLLGLTLVAGRLIHAIGFSADPQIIPMRKLGMYLTVTSLLSAALANIGHTLF